jgi:hypothetical protein
MGGAVRVAMVAAMIFGFGAKGEDLFPKAKELPLQTALPDPFVMFDGSRVETRDDWYTKRRPELEALFRHYMYGFAPEGVEIVAEREAPDASILGGKGVLRQIAIRIKGLPAEAPTLHLALFLPAERPRPVPVFLALNMCGNYTMLNDPQILIHSAAVDDCKNKKNCPDDPEAARGARGPNWCIENSIDRGWAFATIHNSDIDPDFNDFTNGVHPYFKQKDIPAAARWGTISAWAWGLQRCVDYLVADPDIYRGGICVTGHSRRGKTALLAGATDERISIVVPLQSGTGGMALSRENDQETVERINRVFPHWFNGNYKHFDDNEAQLPIDQHLLMSLVAPRPLLDIAGLQDQWANYESAYRGLKAAEPVWEFLGREGMNGTGIVSDNEPMVGPNFGTVVQYRLDTTHTINLAFWDKILDFADAHLGNE